MNTNSPEGAPPACRDFGLGVSRPRRWNAGLPACCITLLLVVAGSRSVAWAQDATIAPAEPLAADNAVTADLGVAAIQARLDAVRAASDLDPKIQAKAIEFYEQAVKSLEQAAASRAQADQYAANDRSATERLEALRSTLATPKADASTIEAEAIASSLTEIEQATTQEQAKLAAAKTKLQETEDRLAREQTRPDELQRAMTDARQRLEQIDEELRGEPPTGEPAVVTESRHAALLARQQMRRAEIAAGEAELAGRELRIEILAAMRDVGLREVSQSETRVAVWQKVLQDRRAVESQRAVDESARAEAQVEAMPEVIRALARDNTSIAQQLSEIREREKHLSDAVEAAAAGLEDLQEDFSNVKQRVELAGLNETIGLVLRQQRSTLPNIRSYRRTARERADQMSELAGQQLENDVRRRSLANLEERLSGITASLDPAISDAVRAQALARAEDLLRQQQTLVGELAKDYGRYIRQLGNLDNAERELVAHASEYRDFINEHLLWIRSTPALGSTTPAQTGQAVGWLADASRWRRVGSDLTSSWARAPFLWVGIALSVGLVIWLRTWARRDLSAVAARIGKIRTDSLALTIRAVADSAILAAGWPFVIGLVGWRVASIRESALLTQALGTGLIGAALLWALFGAVAILLRNRGLADTHYDWNDKLRAALRRHIPWLTATIVPLSIPVAAAHRLAVEDFTGSLARFCFTGLIISLFVWLLLVLRPGGAVMKLLVKRGSGGWITRVRYVWASLLLAIPAGLIALAASGYFYTAMQLGWRLEAMTWMVLGLLVVHQTLMRGVQVAQRRMAWEEAKRKRLEQQAAKKALDAPVASTGDLESIVIEEDEVPLKEITDDTRGFIRTLTGLAAVLLLWTLWVDALPALGFLDRVELWHYPGVVDGVEQQLPVTLASIALAVLIAVITVLAAKNLPGALEISLLKRLPLDTGARYAFTTICKYVIIGVGLVVIFNTLGMSWTSLQWLVAALSVGLGFGLQEIVANFISGIIILFERPFRIGDIVTVGDLSGRVVRIRIRATTIVDWDRRELVVPNKRFITGELINSTLSDPMTRVRVPIGIAYGSDVALARQILHKIAQEHELVLSDPAPAALFLGFGDSALNIELRIFLADIGNKLAVTDQIHERIDTEFKTAGIEIVFPQRDVNLKTPKPVEVVVVDRQSEHRPANAPLAITAPRGAPE